MCAPLAPGLRVFHLCWDRTWKAILYCNGESDVSVKYFWHLLLKYPHLSTLTQPCIQVWFLVNPQTTQRFYGLWKKKVEQLLLCCENRILRKILLICYFKEEKKVFYNFSSWTFWVITVKQKHLLYLSSLLLTLYSIEVQSYITNFWDVTQW